MIKVAKIMLFFACISLHADVKWIPIEPISPNESVKENIKPTHVKLPQIPSVNNLLQNAKVIQQLLDNTRDNEELNMNSEPNWYRLDDVK